MESRDKPASPRALAGAKDAELAARRQREASEAVGLETAGDRDGDDVADDGDDDEEEVTTRVFEVELGGGGSSPWATAFLECASEGDLATLTKLLDDGKVELDDVDVDGFTALMISAAEAQNDVAMELLRRGADVSIRTHEMRSTALHFAAKSGAAQVVEAICTQDLQRVDAQNLDGDTPLVWACTEGRLEAVRVLLAHNANVNVVSHRAMSVLICAVMLRESEGSDDELSDAEEVATTDADRAEIVRLLLTKNPKLVNYQDRDGSTAMHLAASHGYLKCVMALLEFGADITLRNAIGQTPLEEAEETGIEAKSGKCIAHLRMIWKRLEEEAAARMMAMLEMEESSMASGSQAGGGVSRGSKKTNKKKQKKAKRRSSKANPSLPTTEKAAQEKSTLSSGEGSSDEEEELSDKKHDEGGGGDDVDAVESSKKSSKETGDIEIDDEEVDYSQDGGVWTTVGRKHNQYLSQRAADSLLADGANEADSRTSTSTSHGDDGVPTKKKVAPVSPRSKTSRTVSADTRKVSETTPRVPSSRSREKTTVKKVTPAKAKTLVNHEANSLLLRASAMSTAVYPPSPATVPPPPPLAAVEDESLPVNSPFSTFQRLHNNSRLYERYERQQESYPGYVTQARDTVSVTSGLDTLQSSSMWRGSPMGRGVHAPFSLESSVSSHSLPLPTSHDSTLSSAGIWRYSAPTAPQGYERGSLLSSKRLAPPERTEPRSYQSGVDPMMRSLSCGLCGELVSDNRQCSNTPAAIPSLSTSKDSASVTPGTNVSQCVQLYCSSCLTKSEVNGSGTGSSTLTCIKCRLPLHPHAMKRNDFAQAQVATLALASQSASLRHLHQHQHFERQIDPYEDMRLLMHRTSDRVRVASLDPFFLVPGANLTSLSIGQLDALEEVHHEALQRITQARLENARLLERLRMEEWLKTQRDVFQFASHASSS